MQEEKTEIERCDFIHVHEDVVKKVKEHIPAERELNDLAEFFKVFGDVTRLKLLSVLFHSEMCVCDLAKTLNMTQSAISHQLRILKQMKLVKNRRKERQYSILLQTGTLKRLLIREWNIYKSNKRKAGGQGKPANRRKPTNREKLTEKGKRDDERNQKKGIGDRYRSCFIFAGILNKHAGKDEIKGGDAFVFTAVYCIGDQYL